MAYHSTKHKRWLKRQSHRKVRRSKLYVHKGNLRNRIYDFWWMWY